MVELRKRKAHQEPSQPPVTKKKANPVKKVADKVKAAVTGSSEPTPSASSSSGPPTVGSTVTLDGFGGEIETNDGRKTTLKQLIEESSGGAVLFTYPKASTPGCTKQACLFRDDYTDLTATGFAIYGLSSDSTKSNTTFKTKQNLPYTLLCDPAGTLIRAIGLKKNASSTTRGVFVVDKAGKVLAAQPGSPAETVEVVKKLVAEGNTSLAAGSSKGGENGTATAESAAILAAAPDSKDDVEAEADKAKADIAADVADTAAKLDSTPQPTTAAS